MSSECDNPAASCKGEFVIQTKTGRRYSPTVRKLYYTLLAQQLPSNKIHDIVQNVLRCFFPGIDVTNLKLPQRSCADYMRKCELATVSDAHKASVLSDAVSKGYRLNTDGTTKHQRKINGVGINDIVISVNEVSDGTATAAIEDVSKQFEKLRNVAHALHLPNPDRINWTLVVSSTSDSAASQKRFNRLIDDCRERDEQAFGEANLDTVEIIESFCSMHLGINLRKAFLAGMISEEESTDSQVHEFCKVFGKTGAPEYGCGVCTFPDFLTLMLTEPSISAGTRQ